MGEILAPVESRRALPSACAWILWHLVGHREMVSLLRDLAGAAAPQVRQSGHCSSLPSDEVSFVTTRTLISSQSRTEPLLMQKRALCQLRFFGVLQLNASKSGV